MPSVTVVFITAIATAIAIGNANAILSETFIIAAVAIATAVIAAATGFIAVIVFVIDKGLFLSLRLRW